MERNNNEIQLKDILISFSDYKAFLLKKKLSIFFTSILSALFVIILTALFDTSYKAELTFVVEEEKSSASSLGALSGIAGQFGFDFSKSGSTFSEGNIIELLKSRGVVVNTLMQSGEVDGKDNFLLAHYIKINKMQEDFEDFNFAAINSTYNSITLDSINTVIWNNIIDDNLVIDLKSDNATIITLSYTSLNQEFAKVFVENLIDQMSKMYIAHQTAKTNNTLGFLKERADSVFLELEISEKEFAKIQDINMRIVKASGRLKELQLMRRVEVLNTMYLEIVKNLELSKMTLLNQTPIINIIDEPILPLEENKISKILALLFGGLLGGLLSSVYFIFRKVFTEALADS